MGERAVIYLRKTFSDVCHCETRTSHLLPHNGQMDNEDVCVVRICAYPERDYCILMGNAIYVLAWANCVVYPV